MRTDHDNFRNRPAKFISASILLALCIGTGLFAAGTKETGTEQSAGRSVAVFVPGVVSGSPVYEMLVAGVEKAIAETPGSSVKVIEGGYNQAEWESKLNALAAAGSFDLIISSNPALPSICEAVSAKFPTQRFLLLDGRLAGNPHIYTLRYNQREQGYLAGYLAGLVTGSDIPGANPAKKIGLVAGQEYPAMNGVILPGYTEGARAVDTGIEVDFRVVGNWYDAAKGAELSSSMIRDRVDVVLAIAGGANQGVVQAAVDAKCFVIWFDVNGHAIKPGTIIGSAVIHQDKAAYRALMQYFAGTLPFGSAETLGMADGFVDFIEDDPAYMAALPEAIRKRQSSMIMKIRSGELKLPMETK